MSPRPADDPPLSVTWELFHAPDAFTFHLDHIYWESATNDDWFAEAALFAVPCGDGSK